MLLLSCYSYRNLYDHPWVNLSDSYEDLMWEDFHKNNTEKEYPEEFFRIRQYNVNAEIINSSYKDNYLNMLQNIEIIEITQEEANRISYNILTEADKRYFIIRALYPIKGGIYRINLTENNNLYILYSVMAKRDYKPNKDALIIETDEKPNNIYISFSMVS
jgi:hypothetical protein